MGRSLLGVVAGLVLGLALGFVLFSSSRGREPTGAERTIRPARVSAAEPNTAQLQAPSPKPLAAADALPASAPQPVSEKRVLEALARTEVRTAAALEGSGELWGRVEDPDGNGVPGVVVRVHAIDARSQLLEADEVGLAAPELSLEETVRAAAQNYSAARARRFQATTDADGRYRLTGLPDAGFQLQAYKRDHQVYLRNSGFWRIPAGTEVDFLATPLVDVTVRVVLPTGGAPDEAVVQCQTEHSGRTRTESWAWSPDANVLRLPAARLALTGLVGLQAGARDNAEAADMSSEPVSLTLRPGEPQTVDLELRGRSGIRGRVVFAKDVVTPVSAQVRLLSLGPVAEVNLASLANAERYEWVHGSGEYAFLDLEPGRYAVGVSRSWNSPVEDHRVIEVSGTIASCDLELPPIDADLFLVAGVYGPDGAPLEGVEFSFYHRSSDGGGSNSGLRGLIGDDGRYYVAVPARSVATYYGEQKPGESFRFGAMHEEFGNQTVDLEPGQKEIELHFVEAAQLDVTVAAYTGGEFVGLISVSVQADGNPTHSMRRDEGRLDPSGTHRYDALVPGIYEISLRLHESEARHSRNYTIATERVELRAGANPLRLTMPTLYPLEVHVPGASEETRVTLNTVESPGQGGTYRGREACDDTGRTRFEGLPGGEYGLYVSGGDVSGSMLVTVPAGEIVFAPDE